MAWLTIKAPGGPALVQRLAGPLLTVGRGDENDLVLLDPSVSRRHAELRLVGDAWHVGDLASRNGTLLNGVRIDEAARLAAGDEVVVGDTVLWFETSESLARRRGTQRETQDVRSPGDGSAVEPLLVGDSAALRRVLLLVDRFAGSDHAVLVTGESGTGKELVARLIHQRSRRQDGPFIVVNCPALPTSLSEAEIFGVERGVATDVAERAGYVAAAAGGTLFFDEVGDLDLAVQAKLLRLLQDRTFEPVGSRVPRCADVRFAAATNHDLERAIARGGFRRDLFHRLNVMSVHVPPLRERLEDVPALAAHFLQAADGPGRTLTAAALARLLAHDFPGNVRELLHVLLRASLMADGPDVDLAQLPDRLRATAPDLDATALLPHERARRLLDEVLDGRETFWAAVQEPFLRRELPKETARSFVAQALARCGGRYADMARLLGCAEQSRKMLDFLRNHDLQPTAD